MSHMIIANLTVIYSKLGHDYKPRFELLRLEAEHKKRRIDSCGQKDCVRRIRSIKQIKMYEQ